MLITHNAVQSLKIAHDIYVCVLFFSEPTTASATVLTSQTTQFTGGKTLSSYIFYDV